MADGPGRTRLAREQSVGDCVGYDLVVAILVGWLPQIEVIAGTPPQIGRNRSLGRSPSSPAKKLSMAYVSPSGKTNSPMVSVDRRGSRSLATRFPRAHESALSPVANPLCHRSSSDEI